MVNALERIVHKHDQPQDVVAVVCHADPIKLAVAHFLGLPLDHVQRLGCDTGSLAALRIHATGAQLVKLNQHPPFEFFAASQTEFLTARHQPQGETNERNHTTSNPTPKGPNYHETPPTYSHRPTRV